ncbi:DUF2642 domain-containing protein [Falsibacillus pallidus]|uniref:DUF2642 domain-containing protein n=1 Tax=Falsibacillus pallidus TaxID=493781 RepID=A0A370GEB3_9BACI|nr:DUF2642 domain-containing protein [Falsibacillus pallidus]RDI41590.1 hypothetical protein DFR59_10743 [Falsibacillus pallidus]
MSKLIQPFIGETITIELSGKKIVKGVLLEVGSDIVVLYNGEDFLYVPSVHIQYFCKSDKEDSVSIPSDAPSLNSEDEISFRKTLNAARGRFAEIYTTGNQPLHGYITSVMNNYFVFYSPVYKTMLIAIQHVKWLIPYTDQQTPYALDQQKLPVNPAPFTLGRTYEVQIEKLVGELVIFNIGDTFHHIGKINRFEDNIIELVTAREEKYYLNMHHIKTMHLP